MKGENENISSKTAKDVLPTPGVPVINILGNCLSISNNLAKLNISYNFQLLFPCLEPTFFPVLPLITQSILVLGHLFIISFLIFCNS